MCLKKQYGFWQEIHVWFLLKTSDFLSFALIISSDESQSKAQFNTLRLGENNSGYRAENVDFFHRWKLQENSAFVYIDFYTLLKMYYYAKQCQFARGEFSFSGP